MGAGPGSPLIGAGHADHNGPPWSATFSPAKGRAAGVQTLSFCSLNAAATLVYIALTTDGNNHYYLLNGYSLPAGESLILHGEPYLILSPSMTLEMACDADVHYTIHLTERF